MVLASEAPTHLAAGLVHAHAVQTGVGPREVHELEDAEPLPLRVRLGGPERVDAIGGDRQDLAGLDPKPPILWIRGSVDQIVSDASMFDLANLGKLGAVPGWPGEDECPPQPMVTQTRAVLDAYAAAGGSYREVVFEGAGHGPHVEREDYSRGG